MDTTNLHIHQLLDGELDSIIEPSLYGKLAVDADLRNEMREQLALRMAVQEDRALLVPPAALTNSVFTNLGFAAPLAGAAAGAAGGSMLIQWLSRLGIPIASAIAAAGLTFGIASNSKAVANAPGGNEATPTTTQAPSQQELPPLQTQAQHTKGTANQTLPTAGDRTSPQIVYRDNPALQRELKALRTENARLRDELGRQQIASSHTTTNDTDSRNYAAQVTSINLTQDHTWNRTAEPSVYAVRSIALQQPLDAPGYSFQVRGMPLNPTQQTQSEEQSAWYNNLGLAMQYRMNANHSMQLELATETYPMIFEGLRNGQQIRYEQYPSMFWAGVAYRYTFNPIGNSGVAPFTQAGLGGSKYGPIGRLSTGIQYSPMGSVSFLFGIEASSLAYTFQNNWFLSPKVGLTYGMAIRF